MVFLISYHGNNLTEKKKRDKSSQIFRVCLKEASEKEKKESEAVTGMTQYLCHGDSNKKTISKIMIGEESDSDEMSSAEMRRALQIISSMGLRYELRTLLGCACV